MGGETIKLSDETIILDVNRGSFRGGLEDKIFGPGALRTLINKTSIKFLVLKKFTNGKKSSKGPTIPHLP